MFGVSHLLVGKFWLMLVNLMTDTIKKRNQAKSLQTCSETLERSGTAPTTF